MVFIILHSKLMVIVTIHDMFINIMCVYYFLAAHAGVHMLCIITSFNIPATKVTFLCKFHFWSATHDRSTETDILFLYDSITICMLISKGKISVVDLIVKSAYHVSKFFRWKVRYESEPFLCPHLLQSVFNCVLICSLFVMRIVDGLNLRK